MCEGGAVGQVAHRATKFGEKENKKLKFQTLSEWHSSNRPEETIRCMQPSSPPLTNAALACSPAIPPVRRSHSRCRCRCRHHSRRRAPELHFVFSAPSTGKELERGAVAGGRERRRCDGEKNRGSPRIAIASSRRQWSQRKQLAELGSMSMERHRRLSSLALVIVQEPSRWHQRDATNKRPRRSWAATADDGDHRQVVGRWSIEVDGG